MTPIAFSYFIVGLMSFIWPLAVLFLRRHVLGAQWLMVSALIFMGLSMVVYSTFFNTFLQGEYLMVVLFMLFSLCTPPLTQMSVSALTHIQGVPYRARTITIPSLLTVLLMAVSMVISGPDTYRLWIERGADGIGWHFFSHSWRYNLIVVIHYYMYILVIVCETFFVAIYAIYHMHRFRDLLDEYYGANRKYGANIRLSCLAIAVNCICIVVSYILFPFNSPRPLWAVELSCAIESVAVFLIGMCSYRFSFGAEELLGQQKRSPARSKRNLSELSHELADVVEGDKAFLNPDLSVFMLAEKLHVAQDEVVDAIHRLHGTSFKQYIDSLRIEYSLPLLAENDYCYDSAEDLMQVAHKCGYLDTNTFEQCFNEVMQTSVKQWCKSGGVIVSNYILHPSVGASRCASPTRGR